MIKPAFFVLAAALAAGAPARATTYYVATNGNDSYSGTTLSQPFATPFTDTAANRPWRFYRAEER
jgi:hypothetical protein